MSWISDKRWAQLLQIGRRERARQEREQAREEYENSEPLPYAGSGKKSTAAREARIRQAATQQHHGLLLTEDEAYQAELLKKRQTADAVMEQRLQRIKEGARRMVEEAQQRQAGERAQQRAKEQEQLRAEEEERQLRQAALEEEAKKRTRLLKVEQTFKHHADGDYIGEDCPECGCELRVDRVSHRGRSIVCHCGFSVGVVQYLSDVRRYEKYWNSGWDGCDSYWPEPERNAGYWARGLKN